MRHLEDPLRLLGKIEAALLAPVFDEDLPTSVFRFEIRTIEGHRITVVHRLAANGRSLGNTGIEHDFRRICRAATVDEDIGTEIDLQLIHKYNANTVISAGYSVFAGEELFNVQRTSQEDADWAYVQFDVKF